MRVLAPPVVPLYVRTELAAPVEDTAAERAWHEDLARREQARRASSEAFVASDPEWRLQTELLARAERLADVDIGLLKAEALEQRVATLGGIDAAATWPGTRLLVARLQDELEESAALEQATARALQDVRSAQDRAELGQKREARMLELGLRFRGRGEQVIWSGRIERAGLADAPIFTMRSPSGETLKLTAPREVATLSELSGREVTLEGRRLFLVTVSGPVLVVDRVITPDG